MMNIILVGGGSGGHVTPLATVAVELSRIQPGIKLHLITDRGYFATAKNIMFAADDKIESSQIYAGKFRRYSHKPWWWHLIHLPTLLANIRDIFFILIGVFQSLWLLNKLKPNVIFCKGGFVCLPVGLAAHILGIPIVLHDSDSVPGLTARLLSRWARAIAVGSEAEVYGYPAEITHSTGIPINPAFKPVSDAKQATIKSRLGFNESKPILLVIGGGLGAENMNIVVANQARSLLKTFQVAHFAGKGKVDQVRQILEGLALDKSNLDDYHVYDFTNEMPKYLQAADVVVSRAGATAIQEIASVGKPLVLVPGQQLSGGHQIKNANLIAEKHAAKVLSETDLNMNGEILVKEVKDALRPEVAELMIKNQMKLRRPHAAEQIASLILSSARHLSETNIQ